jgi:diaminopimelate epimerase
MTLNFTKMHGLGNDFVIVDGRDTPVAMSPALALALADRRRGIGCDQVILLEASDHADVAMRIFNADGGEVEACGNASRCVTALLGRDSTIATKGGIISGQITDNLIAVAMGQPAFDWQAIPLAHAIDTYDMPVAWDELSHPMAVNVGNPHVVFFVPDCEAVPLDQLGPLIEHDPLFPQRINVNVAHIVGGATHLRVWERGAGLTQACGTGACATAVAAIRRKLVRSPVDVHLPGGLLQIGWAPGDDIRMTGPVTHVFDGTLAGNWSL